MRKKKTPIVNSVLRGRARLVRAWDSRGFTRSPGPTKCAFREMEFPRIQKKKKKF
jgi:hypothetical protein